MRRPRATILPLFLASVASIVSCKHAGDPVRQPSAAGASSASVTSSEGVPATTLDVGELANGAQLLPGMGNHHRSIVTQQPTAQVFFDQGLTLLYGFNHDEASRSFAKAAELDPNNAMAFWGIAIANGPHINAPTMSDDRARIAYDAIQTALRLGGTNDVERALIGALAKRYAPPVDRQTGGTMQPSTSASAMAMPMPHEPRTARDQAYASAMRDVWVHFPSDGDVGALYAEAMMDLRPWDLWTADGRPQPGTEEIVRVLESVLKAHPDHPGANHYMIHAVEASPRPELGLAAADRLGNLVPGAGHLVHMPGHIYMRVGRYEDAAEANRRAIVADQQYVARSPRQDFYRMYLGHNHQFLWAATLVEGKSAESLAAGRNLLRVLPAEVLAAMPEMVDTSARAPLLTLVRFGRWNEVLAEPPLDVRAKLPVSNIIDHWARGLAYVHGSNETLPRAEAELREVEKASAALDPKAIAGNGTPVTTFGRIATEQLAGEISARKGKIDEAVKHFESAVAAEDSIHYNEPPDWAIPTRHLLGAALLDAKRPAQAEAVYRADLKRLPENGYALFGLAASLRARRSPEAADAERRFTKAWSHADVKLTSSRY